MLKKRAVLVLSGVLVCMLWTAIGFAIEVPPEDRFQKDEDLSKNALGTAINQFSTLKAKLRNLADSLPPAQRTVVEETIALVDGKLSRLGSIDVYFPVDPWPTSEPKDSYTYVYDFYVTQGKVSSVQDVSETDVIAMINDLSLIPVNSDYQTTADSLKGIVDQDLNNIPAEYHDLKRALDKLVSDGEVKAATGISGKSRVSILSFYIDPDPALFPAEEALIEKTTLVIATDK